MRDDATRLHNIIIMENNNCDKCIILCLAVVFTGTIWFTCEFDTRITMCKVQIQFTGTVYYIIIFNNIILLCARSSPII